MPEGQRARECTRRAAAEIERLEQETQVEVNYVISRQLPEGGPAGVAPRRPFKSSSKPKQEYPAKPRTQSEECTGCFFTLGYDAVVFGCGHAVRARETAVVLKSKPAPLTFRGAWQFCNRAECVSSTVQICPECKLAIASRKKLFGLQAGKDLASSYDDTSLSKKKRLKKPQKGAVDAKAEQGPQLPPGVTEKKVRDMETKLEALGFTDKAAITAMMQRHNYVFDKVLDALEGVQEDTDLSFEVGQDDISDSDASDDDRHRARTLRSKSKKVYTFEINPASDDEVDEEDETNAHERALERQMTTEALQQKESISEAASDAMFARSVDHAEQAKRMLASVAVKRMTASTDAALTKQVSAVLAGLESSTSKLDGLKAEIVQTMALLKQTATTMSDKERQERIERLGQLQTELESETGAAKNEMALSELAMEGLTLIKALPEKEAETLMLSLMFGKTPLSRALVQHTGHWYAHEKLKRRRTDLSLDISSVQDRSRSVSPSSSRTSIRSFSLPPTARSDQVEKELAEGKKEADPFESLDGLKQNEIREFVDWLVQQCEDLDLEEEAAAAAAREEQMLQAAGAAAAALANAEAAKKAQRDQAPPPKEKKRGMFGGMFASKKQPDKKEETTKDGQKKGFFGSIFSSKVDVKVEKEKEPDMPEDAAKALAEIAEAQKLRGKPGYEAILMQIGLKCSEALQPYITQFEGHSNAEKLQESLKEGVKLAGQTFRAAREALLTTAEEGIRSCSEHEAQGELQEASKEADRAMRAYESLGMMMEASVCSKKKDVLQLRARAQPYIKDGMHKIAESLFRIAIPALEEARRVLTDAPRNIQVEISDVFQEVDARLTECRDKLKHLAKCGPRYWRKAQKFHGENTPEAQCKASVLYKHAANAFNNVQEVRAEQEARRLQQLTAENVMKLAIKKCAHLEIMDQFDESISLYDWLKAWLEHCDRVEVIAKVDKLQRSTYHQRAVTRLNALTYMCDDGLRQLKRGYRKGKRLLELIERDLYTSHNGKALTEEETSQIATLSRRLIELQRISDTWFNAYDMDPKQHYDERMIELSKIKKQVEADRVFSENDSSGRIIWKGSFGERLIWDMGNVVLRISEQRKYQAGLMQSQTGADKMLDQAMLELRKLRAHMQLTFDDCQDEAGRERIQEMARACRTVLATASETFQHCEAWDKKKKVDEVVGDVDFELERWVIRQDDLRQRLKELTRGRRDRAREKLEREALEHSAAAAAEGHFVAVKEVTEEDVSREILKVDAERKIDFGRLEEGKFEFRRSQILYHDATKLMEGVDEKRKEAAADMLNTLDVREQEFEEILAASNLAARNLWEERAEMLCRQAKKRTAEIGGPSQNQFESTVSPKAPALMRESFMASCGRRIVFRPAFDSKPLLQTERAEGTTHAVNMRPLNERAWLHTESMYNPTPGKVAMAKFTESLSPTAPTTKANYFGRPMANMSAGLVNAPESEKADYRIMPVGPANRPCPPTIDPVKF